jgi:hypothetical protein
VNKPDAVDEANEEHRPKRREVTTYSNTAKSVPGVKPQGLRPQEGIQSHAHNKPRGPRKWKPPPTEEHQSSVVTDPELLAADNEQKLQEKAQGSEEFEIALSSLTQRRPVSSSGSAEKPSEVQDMETWINNSYRCDDVFPREIEVRQTDFPRYHLPPRLSETNYHGRNQYC